MVKFLGDCLTAIVCLIIIFALFLLAFRISFSDKYLTKEEIFELVNSKYDILADDIQKDDFTKSNKIKGITEIERIDGVIDFSCGGKGNVASGAYYGFYYTEDDLPKVSFLGYVSYDEEDLKPEGNGYCYDAYDYYYTEKITDNFYYYEAHY